LNCSPSSAPARCFAADLPRRDGECPPRASAIAWIAPGIAAGTSLGISDVLAKIVLLGGVDVVSMFSFRSLVGLAFVATWFRFRRRVAASAQVRTVSIIVGIISVGLTFCLFKAIDTIDVPTAAFLFHLSALDRTDGWTRGPRNRCAGTGVICAVVAFCGLALLIDAHPRASRWQESSMRSTPPPAAPRFC
jgi:hypothetical protein